MNKHPNQDFSLKALHDALLKARCARGLSWAAIAREINGRFHGGSGQKVIATSTVSGLNRRSLAEGDGVLQILLWLGRSPESFVPGLADAQSERYRLQDPGPDQILRWDTAALYQALNDRRQARQMSWRDLSSELTQTTPAMLTGLEKGGRTRLPWVMKPILWLDLPACAFTRASAG